MPVGRRAAVELPDNREWIEAWERRLDPAQTSIRQFMELFKVPTKRVVRGKVAMTPFRMYDFQVQGLAIIENQWRNLEGGKTLGGKARQEGETTAKLLLAWERFCRGGGGTWNYFSYDDAKSIEAFSLLLKLKRQIPDWVYEFLINQSEPGAHDGGGYWTKKSHRQLELSFPGAGGASLLQCATAGGEFAGSGSAPRGVFLDEFTKYPPDVKADHTGISEGWADAPGNVFAYWGTGQGADAYSKIFLDHYNAQKAQKTNDDGFVAYFKSWLGHPDRRTPFARPIDRDLFERTVGKVKEFGPRDEIALQQDGATLEELNWRRRKLASPSFKYDLKLFSRENPRIPEDMFVSESGTVFQVEILKTHDSAAAAKELAARHGDFVEKGDDVVFVPNAAGSWVLYEERKDDMFVCWGGDSASGKTKHAGSGKEADHADGKFKEVYSGRTVARFDAHLEGSKFGEELLNAARYFRCVLRDGTHWPAKGFPEINNRSGMAMMMGMERYCEDRRLDFFDFVMMQLHPVLSDGKRPEPSPGWETTRTARSGGASAGSKGILVDTTKLFIADVGDFDPKRGTPYDTHTLGQMYKYESDDKGGWEAASGFDDAVSSEMLSLVARDYLISGMTGGLPLSSKVSTRPTADPFDEYLRAMATKKKRSPSCMGKAF